MIFAMIVIQTGGSPTFLNAQGGYHLILKKFPVKRKRPPVEKCKRTCDQCFSVCISSCILRPRWNVCVSYDGKSDSVSIFNYCWGAIKFRRITCMSGIVLLLILYIYLDEEILKHPHIGVEHGKISTCHIFQMK